MYFLFLLKIYKGLLVLIFFCTLTDLLAAEEHFTKTKPTQTLKKWVENDDEEWWRLQEARNPAPPGGKKIF